MAMMQRTVLLIHDGDWHWPVVEDRLRTMPEVDPLHVAGDAERALERVSQTNLDIVITKPVLNDEPIAPVITELRNSFGFTGGIYIIAQQSCISDVATYSRVGVDGLLVWPEIPRDLLTAFLSVLVSGDTRIASMSVCETYDEMLRDNNQLPTLPVRLTERQIRLVKLWCEPSYDPTYADLARDLGVHVSTVKREIGALYEIFGVCNRGALGSQATVHGYLP